MALYIHELTFVFSETELLSVYKIPYSGGDAIQLLESDYIAHFDFSTPSSITFNASVNDLFSDLEIGFISHNDVAGFGFDLSALQNDGTYVFRSIEEQDAYVNGTLFTTDFHPVTPPSPVTVDLSEVLTLLNDIKTKQISDNENVVTVLGSLTSNVTSLASSFHLVADSIDVIRTTVSQLPGSVLHTDFHNELVAKIDLIDFVAFQDSLETIKTYTDSLENGVSSLATSISNLTGIAGDGSLNSLNGQGCEFKDGAKVLCEGRDTVYTVASSRYFLIDDTSYTALYSLTSPTGETLSAPEALLTRSVASVTTP